jgi:hypothetical protein
MMELCQTLEAANALEGLTGLGTDDEADR